MSLTKRRAIRPAAVLTAIGLTILGTALGLAGNHGTADPEIPTEHAGLQVKSLGVISGVSMAAQIGLDGYKLQLREITIEPGGQIGRHSHEARPGIVRVISGTWTEGRPDRETEHTASNDNGILEDEETVHWFWNRGTEPATAMVCDLVPDS